MWGLKKNEDGVSPHLGEHEKLKTNHRQSYF